jgi:hypothetical protein
MIKMCEKRFGGLMRDSICFRGMRKTTKNLVMVCSFWAQYVEYPEFFTETIIEFLKAVNCKKKKKANLALCFINCCGMKVLERVGV